MNTTITINKKQSLKSTQQFQKFNLQVEPILVFGKWVNKNGFTQFKTMTKDETNIKYKVHSPVIHIKQSITINDTCWSLKQLIKKTRKNKYKSSIGETDFLIYWKYTHTNDDFVSIDVDNKDEFVKMMEGNELLSSKFKTTPYLKSRNKRLPHYLVKMKNLPKHFNRKAIRCGDIIKNGWIKLDEDIQRLDRPIVEVDYNDIITNTTYTYMDKSLSGCNDNMLLKIVGYFRADSLASYENFRNFTFSCVKLNISQTCWDTIAKRFDGYDYRNNLDLWNSIKNTDHIKCGWTTLLSFTTLSIKTLGVFRVICGLDITYTADMLDYPEVLYELIGVKYCSSKGGVYYWNEDTLLWDKHWTSLFRNDLSNLVEDVKLGLDKHYEYRFGVLNKNKGYDYDRQVKDLKTLIKLSKQKVNKLHSLDLEKKLRERFTDLLVAYKSVVLDYHDEARCFVQFRNGAYDLRIGSFRPRVKADNISNCLDWDWDTAKYITTRCRIRDMLRKIQPTDDDYEFMMSFIGYGLTPSDMIHIHSHLVDQPPNYNIHNHYYYNLF